MVVWGMDAFKKLDAAFQDGTPLKLLNTCKLWTNHFHSEWMGYHPGLRQSLHFPETPHTYEWHEDGWSCDLMRNVLIVLQPSFYDDCGPVCHVILQYQEWPLCQNRLAQSCSWWFVLEQKNTGCKNTLAVKFVRVKREICQIQQRYTTSAFASERAQSLFTQPQEGICQENVTCGLFFRNWSNNAVTLLFRKLEHQTGWFLIPHRPDNRTR